MKWRLSRDSILFMSGLAGMVWQTVVETTAQSELIVAFLAMMGLPAFLRSDEKRKDSA